MDTPSSFAARPLLPRWLRVGIFVVLIASVSAALTYLATWVDSSRAPHFVSIRVDGESVFAGTEPTDAKLNAIRQTLDNLAAQRPDRPVVVYLGGTFSFDESGNLLVAMSDGRLPMREVLEKLKACPAKQKLLVLDLDRDAAGAIPRELHAVADADRSVLCSASPGQSAHISPELGQSIFAHYFHAGLAGDADGYGDLRDGHISVKELAAFVQARVERWAMHNRGERQTPMLLGSCGDFTIASVDPHATRAPIEFRKQHKRAIPSEPEALAKVQSDPKLTQPFSEAWQFLDMQLTGAKSTAAKKAKSQSPYLPGYVNLLDEPARAQHTGEILLLTRGYSSLEDAKARLLRSEQMFEQLIKLNEKWRECERLLDDTDAELPRFFEAMETLPELRTPWEQSAIAVRALADALKTIPNDKLDWTVRVGRLSMQIEAAEKHATTLQQHRQKLHAPFGTEAVGRLDRQCRSAKADAEHLRHANAVLNVAVNLLAADDRAALQQAADQLSRRLLEETLALDKRDHEAKHFTPISDSSLSATTLWLRPLQRDHLLELLHNVTTIDTASLKVRRRDEQMKQSDWLRDRRRDLARDYQGLNFESPGIVAARAFYADKGTALEAHVCMKVTTAVAPLTEKQPYAIVTLEVTRQVPPGAFGPTELKFHRADDVWLEIAPETVTLPALADSKEPRTLTEKVPLKVSRKAKAERTGLPPPHGFLVEARFQERSYHQVVKVPIVPTAQELQILVSADPVEPSTPVNEIRVRPGKVKQPHYVYVQNLTNRIQKVHVEITAGDKLVYKSQKLVTVDPDAVRKVTFDGALPMSELLGPLAVRVLDQDRQKVLQERALPVAVLSPRDYVQAAGARYDPGNKWAVQVETSRSVVGPAIAAQLVLPVQRIPGLMSVGGGTLHVELPTQLNSPRTLFAEKLQMIPTAKEEGPVYLHIDGVARAFVFSTTFTRAGVPTQPTPDDCPAVRLVAPQCVMSGVNCLVDVEVDNAPAGCKLEVALGRVFDDLTFKPEVVREFTDAKKRRIDLETSKDALVFAAAIDDWTATFDTRSIVGSRVLRARLIGGDGQQLAGVWQSMLIDDSPPLARIAPLPAQVKKGTVLQVQAQGSDPESGVAQVHFFYGKPDKGEIPPAAVRVKAVPANLDGSVWSAALQVPADHKGPLVVSVQVVNRAGMATTDTVTLDVTDREPGKTGMGEIRGTVVEGPRPQPNLTVILTDERGKEIARTRTQADGSYLFEQIAPGRYRLVCVKPESQRRAIMGVTVEPDRAVRINLSLSL